MQYQQLSRRLLGQPGQMRVFRESSEWTLPKNHQEILLSELDSVRSELMHKLVTINILIIFLGAGGSYFLSGKTLKPIEFILEKQKQFVADAAHELKTPLTALQTSLEVNLMDKKLNRNIKQILKENLEDVTQLSTLANRLLNLSQLENNQIVVSKNSFDLDTIIKKAIKNIQPKAKQKQIKILFKNEDNLSINVITDKELLTELIEILLDNAVKYTPSGKDVEIQVDKQKRQAYISVIDKGVGISEIDQKRIFDRFFQVDQSRSNLISKTEKSFGLGLAIAKEISKNINAKIYVESELNKGSTFTIQLLCI
jgi:signal transduction histidine kinase